MDKFNLNKAVIFFVFILAIFFSFIIGFRYAQYLDSKDLLVIHANMIGNQIIETNLLIDIIEKDPSNLTEVRNNFNNSMLVDIGCSLWIEALFDTSSNDLHDFNLGIQKAYEYIDRPDSKCIKNLSENWNTNDYEKGAD